MCVSGPLCTGTSLVSFVSLSLSVLFQERRDNVCSQVRSGLLLDSHREHSALHSVLSSAHLCTCHTLSVHTQPSPNAPPAMPSASLNMSPCRIKTNQTECAFSIPSHSIRLDVSAASTLFPSTRDQLTLRPQSPSADRPRERHQPRRSAGLPRVLPVSAGPREEAVAYVPQRGPQQ